MSNHSRKRRITRQGLSGLVLSMSLGVVGCGAQPLSRGPVLPQGTRAAFARCGVDADGVEAVWREYRAARPLHAQQVAASEPLAGGCRVLILAEPPADATVAALGEVHPALNVLIPKRHPVGVDGWTEDLVGVVPPMSTADLADLTSDLHVALFGSAYRARLAPIAASPRWTGTLDIEVRPAEVYDWVFGQEASFLPVDGGPPRSASELLEPRQTGIYVSTTSGLVLWSLPKTGSFDAQKANVRMFGLESDLVLGAVADEDTVLVIGRERVAPEDASPPLRFETVKMLATTSRNELQQSYERTALFAGSLRSGEEWAPILLSPALVDTELGSVLNITDQMLKRWSSNGALDSARVQYPHEPTRWASSKPISQELGASSLSFNWNTRASGGLVKVSSDRTLYWMNRTGALQVSHLPEEKPDHRIALYEDRERDFFANQSDPYLVRAVQYTALFQAFRQLGVTSVDEVADVEAQIDVSPAMAVLEDEGTRALQRLLLATPSELHSAATRAAERRFANVRAGKLLVQMIAEASPEERRKIEAHLDDASAGDAQRFVDSMKQRSAAKATRIAGELQASLKERGDSDAPRHLAVALAHPGLVERATNRPADWDALLDGLRPSKARAKALEIKAAGVFLRGSVFGFQNVEKWRDTTAMLSDVDALAQRYSEVSGARTTTSRVRTPTIVQSPSARTLYSGGHNVVSHVPTPFEVGEPLQLPQLKFDRAHLTFTDEASPPRPRPLSIAIGALAARPPRLALVAEGQRSAPPLAPGGGWARLTGEPPSSCGARGVEVRLFDRGSSASTAVAAPLQSRFKVAVDDGVFRAGSSADIAETAVSTQAREARQSGIPSARVDIKLLDADISPREAQSLARSIHTRLARRGLGAEDSFVLQRSSRPVALEDFDLTRAVVSEPVRTGEEFVISVSVPRKAGGPRPLVMRLLGKGPTEADAAAKTQQALNAGLRTPADIARELQGRFGKQEAPLLLELTIDARGEIVDNTLPLPKARYGGAPGHSF